MQWLLLTCAAASGHPDRVMNAPDSTIAGEQSLWSLPDETLVELIEAHKKDSVKYDNVNEDGLEMAHGVCHAADAKPTFEASASSVCPKVRFTLVAEPVSYTHLTLPTILRV